MATAAKAREWRARMRREGRCGKCGKPKEQDFSRCDKCMAQIREESNRDNRLLKLQVIAAYGGRCSGVRTTGACSEADVDILEIDHINGGGNRHREETGLRGVNFYRSLRRDGYPAGYRVLCRNCNWLAHLKRLVS